MVILKPNQEFGGLKLIGDISFTELLGDQSIAEVRLPGSLIKTTNINSSLDELAIGSEVTLGVSEDKLVLFSKSGNRIDL